MIAVPRHKFKSPECGPNRGAARAGHHRRYSFAASRSTFQISTTGVGDVSHGAKRAARRLRASRCWPVLALRGASHAVEIRFVGVSDGVAWRRAAPQTTPSTWPEPYSMSSLACVDLLDARAALLSKVMLSVRKAAAWGSLLTVSPLYLPRCLRDLSIPKLIVVLSGSQDRRQCRCTGSVMPPAARSLSRCITDGRATRRGAVRPSMVLFVGAFASRGPNILDRKAEN
jgi:hypothetical protein